MTEWKKEQKIMATKTEAPAVLINLRDLAYAIAAKYKIPLAAAQVEAEKILNRRRQQQVAERNAPAIAAMRMRANEAAGMKVSLRDLARSIAAKEGLDMGTAQRKAEAILAAHARHAVSGK